jgi:thiol-disulfide isomerase/thioredoxin
MIKAQQIKLERVLFCFLLLGFFYPSAATGQAVPGSEATGAEPSPALRLLYQAFDRYAQASTYHFEILETRELSGPFRRSWDRVITTAIAAPGNRYRFEVRAEEVWIVQVSDGSTEWLYQPELNEYMQRHVEASGPGPLPSTKSHGAYQLKTAQGTLRQLIGLQKLFLSAAFLPNEEVDVNGKHVSCRVIKATRKELPGLSPQIVTQVTFWVDENENVIRKIVEHTEGPLRSAHPEDQYVDERTRVFNVANFETDSDPSRFFVFTPPSNAALVKDFDSDPLAVRLHGFVGKQVPMVDLGSSDGPTVSLQSFSGKFVLLDFWATWCAPCITSLPSLEKLHQELAPKGLVMLSVDEDEEAKKASEFWATRKEPWPNFHTNKDIGQQFPEHGVPYLVLINESGKVVFSEDGYDESKVRAAVARLSPAFASISPETSK